MENLVIFLIIMAVATLYVYNYHFKAFVDANVDLMENTLKRIKNNLKGGLK